MEYSASTSFRLPFIEPSAREVLIVWTLIKREELVRSGEENMAQTDRNRKRGKA